MVYIRRCNRSRTISHRNTLSSSHYFQWISQFGSQSPSTISQLLDAGTGRFSSMHVSSSHINPARTHTQSEGTQWSKFTGKKKLNHFMIEPHCGLYGHHACYWNIYLHRVFRFHCNLYTLPRHMYTFSITICNIRTFPHVYLWIFIVLYFASTCLAARTRKGPGQQPSTTAGRGLPWAWEASLRPSSSSSSSWYYVFAMQRCNKNL